MCEIKVGRAGKERKDFAATFKCNRCSWMKAFKIDPLRISSSEGRLQDKTSSKGPMKTRLFGARVKD